MLIKNVYLIPFVFQVTFRLLEAEKRKLAVLQSELGQLNNNDYGHDVAQVSSTCNKSL